VIILDENIFADQRLFLSKRKISLRQIGFDLSKKGITDEEIIPLLQKLSRPTFFTRDRDFFRSRFCHSRYCLAWLDVRPLDVGETILRFLRHPHFRSRNDRLGKVIRVSPKGITFWQKNEKKRLAW
jgi:hypothetical protein